MDLLSYTKYVCADQFLVQKVNEDLLCVTGPHQLSDGSPLDIYLRETPASAQIELMFYCGLAEDLSMEALGEAGVTDTGRDVLDRYGLELKVDRVGATATRDNLLERICDFGEAIVSLESLIRETNPN